MPFQALINCCLNILYQNLIEKAFIKNCGYPVENICVHDDLFLYANCMEKHFSSVAFHFMKFFSYSMSNDCGSKAYTCQIIILNKRKSCLLLFWSVVAEIFPYQWKPHLKAEKKFWPHPIFVINVPEAGQVFPQQNECFELYILSLNQLGVVMHFFFNNSFIIGFHFCHNHTPVKPQKAHLNLNERHAHIW